MARLRHLYQKNMPLECYNRQKNRCGDMVLFNFSFAWRALPSDISIAKGKERARASNKYGESRSLTDALCEQLQEKNNYLLTEKDDTELFLKQFPKQKN